MTQCQARRAIKHLAVAFQKAGGLFKFGPEHAMQRLKLQMQIRVVGHAIAKKWQANILGRDLTDQIAKDFRGDKHDLVVITVI